QVLRYQTWCRELEQQVKAGGGSLSGRWEATADHNLEKALLQVEEEQQRCENLAEVNTLLREHLDKASEVNSALREDVGKLTVDWMRAREELELKESEWRHERELYDNYLRGEHNRLLSLWRQVVTFRRHFLEMKTATDRDLSELKAEQMRLCGSILVNCSHLNSSVRLRESIALGKPVLKGQADQQMEQKINHKIQEVRWDLEKKELQDRVMELSALLVQSQKQNEEKEKTMKTLNDTVEILESSWIEKEFEASLTKSAKEENLFLQKLIKNITELDVGSQVVLDDSDSLVSIICTDSSHHAESGNIFSAPRLVDTGHAFGLVLEALARMRGATQALREELSAREDSNNFLLQQQRQQEEKCREVQQKLEKLEEKCKRSSSHQQHLQSLVEELRRDCANLEKTREELQQQLGLMEQEASCLRQSKAELQLKEESAQAEKAEQQERMERARRDQELLVKDLAALEGKHSSLQRELLVMRQTLEKLQLQRDLLEQEKDELTMALEKAERSVAELTGAQNKLNAERADLRAAAAKMSSINEALALDKVQLNKHMLQLEQEKEVLSAKVDEMERAKVSEQEKLNFCERANEELSTEKAQLEQLLKEAEEQQEELRVELRALGEEKAETQEKFCQVSREKESAGRALEQLRQESSRQEQALAQACREKELLGREKAALEVRLAATERDRQGISEQLAEARSVKETLESSLFAAQQQVSQLEITRSHLEAQLHTVMQAKEVIQGEVKCLQCELEAERALGKQEREDMAQQLLQAEQQYHDTLRLEETAHQGEIKKLLQDLASEREEHHAEMQKMLKEWEKGKAETEEEHKKILFEMRQKVATLQAQQEEERTRLENAKQEVLLEKQNEKSVLLETLLQTQGELSQACQQVQQLRQEMQEQQEKGQIIKAKLQAELQEAQRELQAAEKRHKEELESIQEEMNLLLEQREDLQKQLAACRESHEAIAHKAQQDVSEAQELSKQKMLEIEKLQLTVCLEEKELSLRTLEEKNLAQQNQVSELHSALHQAKQLLSDRTTELQELNNQEAVQEKEAALAAREEQLLQALEESRAGERSLKDSLQTLEAEGFELRLRLRNSEKREEALATECQQASSAHQETRSQLDKLHLVLHHMISDCRDLVTWSSGKCGRLEQGSAVGLTASQARDLPTELTVDRVAAALQDLRQHLEQTQKDLNDTRKKTQVLELELSTRQAERDHWCARNQELHKQLAESQEEHKRDSLEAALKEEASARKEEAVTLRQEVESLQRKLESTEKQGQDVLHERDRLQAEKEKLECQIKLLEESLTASETRANTARDTNHSLEQELQTALSLLKIKNEEVENQMRKTEMLQKEAAEGKALQDNLARMTAILSEREREMKVFQEQMRVLEKQKEMQKAALNQVIKDITEKEKKTESQQEQIQELEKQQEQQRIALSKELEEREREMISQQEQIQELEKQREMERAAVSRVSKELEEREQEIRSQQELIGELEKQLELQSTAVSKVSKELEEREQEIRSQEEKIMVLEQHGASQVRNLLEDLDHVKGNLKEKNLELLSLTQQIQELEKEREQGKTLHTNLEHLRAALKDRESECDTQREELKLLQQHKEQQEGHLQELLGKVENMTLSLSKKEQELESQQKQIQEVEEALEMQLRTVRDQLEQTLATLKEKDRLIDIQKQQTRSYEEKTEQQMNVLHRDLEYTRAVLKEKDIMIESQKELIETFQKQQEDSEQQKEILQHLQVELKEKEQEILSLRKQCEACKEKEEKHEAQQNNFQAAALTLKEREEASDQERASLDEHVQDLREQKEVEGRQAKSLEQDQGKMRQMLQENHLEFLKQTEQMNMVQLHEESMKVALTLCQKQITLLEEVVRKKDEDNETLLQKLRHQEEVVKTWQNLQLRAAEKNEEVRREGEQEKLLQEAFPEREGETKAQSDQKELEEVIRALREDLQHIQQTLMKKDEEIKYQTDRVRYLEEALQKELTQQWQAERKANGEELECVAAALKQTQSRELEWREKAQVLRAALTKSEMAKGTLLKELDILQRMVSERDTDRFHQQQSFVLMAEEQLHCWSLEAHGISSLNAQQAVAEGEQLSWLSEKRLMSQSLECLQRTVARLEDEKVELKQQNAELRRTLEQVERERRRLKRCFRDQMLPDACGLSLSQSDQHKVSTSRQVRTEPSLRLAELQNQVSLLQSQLAQDRQHRQNYIESCARTNQELSDLHQELSCSLAAVLREPRAAVLEAETQKLDQSLNLALMSLDCQSPERQRVHPAAQ
ncbi:Centrosome-associated protein CEP250, partial [Manacus vitellinus]